jgi:hypothetical protein
MRNERDMKRYGNLLFLMGILVGFSFGILVGRDFEKMKNPKDAWQSIFPSSEREREIQKQREEITSKIKYVGDCLRVDHDTWVANRCEERTIEFRRLQ